MEILQADSKIKENYDKEIDEEVYGQFTGIYGPLEDEIYIRKYYEKHKNTPLFRGAFKNCKINGIASKKDTQRYNDWFWRSIYTAVLSTSVFGFIWSILTVHKLGVPDTILKSRKHMIGFIGSNLLFTIPFIYYKNYKLKEELDLKYTPLYLKSKGKL